MQRPAELLEQVGEPVPTPEVGVRVELLRDARQDLHVREHLLADAGPLHLDDDLAVAPQRRAVDLPQGRRRQRHLVERGEHPRDPHAQLAGDDLLDLREGERLDVVLQPRQRLGVRRRQQVHAAREQLPELDVRRTHRLEVGRQLLGAVRVTRVRASGSSSQSTSRPADWTRSRLPYFTRSMAIWA